MPLDALRGRGSFSDYSGPTVPTALHPPLFPAVLALGSAVGLDSYEAHRIIGCLLGAGTVGVVGLIGRRVGGATLGLVGAGLAAVYLPLIANDSVLMSESLFGLTIALTILAALRLADTPSWPNAALLGAAIGLAALTRSEALLLVALIPFVARAWRPASVAVLATVIVIAPWCIRNSLAFDRPLGISTGDGPALAGSNTDVTYRGDLIGTWDFGGLKLSGDVDRTSDAETGEKLRDQGLDYAREHAGRVPLVVAARVLRTWSVYPFDPREKVRYTALAEKRKRGIEWLTLLSGWAVILLGIAGLFVLRRRGARLAPFVAPIVLATVVSALFYGGVRFREAADVALIVPAAACLVRVARRGEP